MKNTKRLVAMALVIVTMCSLFAVSASAATWRTGNFGKGYTTVYLSDTEKDGYIKIRTYNCIFATPHTGKCFGAGETSAKLHITLRDTSGNWLCEFNTTSKTKLRLGNDHNAYRVYISCRQDLGNSANFINLGKCAHWAIECVKNTKF